MNRILIMALLLFSPLCNGAGFYSTTPNERQLCISKFGVSQGSGDHICDCMRFYYRAAREAKREDIKYYASEAVGSCTYFMARHRENKGDRLDQFYPAAQMYRGLAHVLLKDRAKAKLDLIAAIQLNPHAQAAYLQLADLESGAGNKSKALDILTEGLKHLSESKTLQRRYLALGGKEPFPEPYRQAVEAPQNNESPQDTQRPAASGEEREQAVPSQETKPVAPEPSQALEVKPLPVGSSTNPWCRFCPEEPAKPNSPPGSEK